MRYLTSLHSSHTVYSSQIHTFSDLHFPTKPCRQQKPPLCNSLSNFRTMGSCISTKKTAPPPKLQPPQTHHLQDRALVPESDPPSDHHCKKSTTTNLPSTPPLEEETVKEVLSETPLPKQTYLKYPTQQKILRLPSFPKLQEQRKSTTQPPYEEFISVVSEICSLSESVSTSGLTEQSRDYEEVSKPRLIDRSPSKIQRKITDSSDFYNRGESPVRRSEHLVNAGKSVYGGQVLRQRDNVAQGGVMRDQGESSRRRSRSPVTRVEAGGMFRSPPAKRVVQSPGKSMEIGRNWEEAKEGKRPVKESLEDPLVSLECFIFL